MNDWHLQHVIQMEMSGVGMFVVEATAAERRGLITTAEQTNNIIKKENADMVALGRTFLANQRRGWDASIYLNYPIKVPPQYERAMKH